MTEARPRLEPLDDALMRVGRNDGPALLFDRWFGGAMDRAALVKNLPGVWSLAEWPAANLPRSVWIGWFRLAAYPPPAEPLVVYRGATPSYARGMSWTTDCEQAAWFAHRWTLTTGRSACVYTVEAVPDAVLASIDALDPEGRREAEVVVDPTMLGRLRRVGDAT